MRVSKRPFLLILLAAAAACAPPADPADAPAVRDGLTMIDAPPVYSLLGYRDRLDLTSAQVAALDSVARAVQEQNRPLVEELREQTQRARPQSRRPVVTEEMQPLLERISENNRAAMAAVQEVLTPEQEATACRLAAGPSDRPQPERRARGGARRGTAPADSLRGTLGGRVWSWCSPAAGAPSL